MGQRPLTSERAQERRRQLLEVARKLFEDRDYDDVSVDEIADAAGVSHGLVFQYFGTKRDLYVAGVAPLIDEFRARIQPDPELEPVERLRSALRAYADVISEHPVGYRSLMTRGVGFREVREALEAARSSAVERIAPQMGLDPARPEVRVGIRAWIGYLDTAMLTWVEAGGKPPRDELVDMIAASLGATAAALSASA